MKFCPRCRVGRVSIKTLPYLKQQDKHVVVDRIPALVCDTCGEVSYDSYALQSLQRLLLLNRPELPTQATARA